VLNNIHNYKKKTAMISDFQGKLLILDFWATWCSPCVAMRPKMEELQQQFNGKIQFLSVTYQKAEEVLPFLEKIQKDKPSILPEIMDDKILYRFFPHVYLPHYVWVDQTGKVKAITGFNEVTKSNID
jgi:thiol-disulfide isomerase/thioredoxin